MSASLVGSEMCIRDSSRIAGASAWECTGVRGTRFSGDQLRADPELLLAPVSYTHLTLPTICSV
eukprot:14758125-Alexandrium_andersonii.AAC.1